MGKKSSDRREEKREKFQKASKNTDRPWVFKRIMPLALIAIVLLGGARFLWFYRNSDKNGVKQEPSEIQMKEIQAKVEDGKIVIPLSTVKKDKLVYFEYKGNKTVPLLSYIGPSGKVIAAISLCEPCKSQRFHIVDDNLVCNACGTIWNLETHQGVSGGCTEFPPELIPNEVKGGNILIDEGKILNWKPRQTKLNKDAT